MVDIEWEDPPEVAVLRSSGGGRYLEFAMALREHPGRWAVLPNMEGKDRSDKGAKATGQNIKAGKIKGFTKGLYETAVQGGKVWVRYNPPADEAEAPQGDAATPQQPEQDKPKAADVRAWANRQGMAVPDRGALPRDVLEAYNDALAKGEVGLPLRVMR